MYLYLFRTQKSIALCLLGCSSSKTKGDKNYLYYDLYDMIKKVIKFLLHLLKLLFYKKKYLN